MRFPLALDQAQVLKARSDMERHAGFVANGGLGGPRPGGIRVWLSVPSQTWPDARVPPSAPAGPRPRTVTRLPSALGH
jgi:hypothetical protein